MRAIVKTYVLFALGLGIPYGALLVPCLALSPEAPERPLWQWFGFGALAAVGFGFFMATFFLGMAWLATRGEGKQVDWDFVLGPPGPPPDQHPLPAIEPTWCTPAVLALARQASDNTDVSAWPILADALEEAGCTDADLLGRLRRAEGGVEDRRVADALLGR